MLEKIGRKPTTLTNYRSILGFRLLPRLPTPRSTGLGAAR
jgi:hypothetical protein